MQPMYQGPIFANQAPTIRNEQQPGQLHPQLEAFDEEAFARAFDEAAQSEVALEQGQQHGHAFEQDIMMDESAERFMESDHLTEQVRLGADLIHDPLRDDDQPRQEQDDPDALARTAAQLLDSVKDNQSHKFQNSTFLELMRQLRDKEVTVEGDKLVGVRAENGTPIEQAAP